MELKDISFEDFDVDKVTIYNEKLDSIFEYNLDINKTAYLNWRTRYNDSRQQFVIMGEAFFSTAYNLLQQCLIDNSDKKADLWIFPIMFNIIHGMEVYLKAINSALHVLLEKEDNIIFGGHDLKIISKHAHELIVEYKEKNQDEASFQFLEGIQIVENFISNIYKKTDDMTFVRYPLARNKKGHFYIEALNNVVIDLELLKEQVLYIFNMLDFTFNELSLRLEQRTDYLAEMMKYYE